MPQRPDRKGRQRQWNRNSPIEPELAGHLPRFFFACLEVEKVGSEDALLFVSFWLRLAFM